MATRTRWSAGGARRRIGRRRRTQDGGERRPVVGRGRVERRGGGAVAPEECGRGENGGDGDEGENAEETEAELRHLLTTVAF